MGLNSEELNKRVQVLMGDELWDDAITLLESLPSVVENHAELSWNLGWAYFKKDEWKRAERHLAQAVKLAPNKAASRWALGVVQDKDGKLREAEGNLKEALCLRDSSIFRQTLALVLMKRGKIAEAEQVHLRGIELKPESAKRWDVYACFLDDVGRQAEADAAYRKARLLTGS